MMSKSRTGLSKPQELGVFLEARMDEAAFKYLFDNGADANRLNANNETLLSLANSKRTRE